MSRLASTTLRMGDLAPPFELPAIRGDLVRLSDALGHAAVLLVFSPGSWSPATRSQFAELAATYERLQLAGIALLVVVTQDLRRLRLGLAARPYPFPVLADERRSVARDYGVYRAFSRDGIGVTAPSVFVIDRAGLLRFVYVGAGDGDLPEADGLIRLATWLVRAAAAEADEPGPFPAEGEIWLDEQPASPPPDQATPGGSPESDSTPSGPAAQPAPTDAEARPDPEPASTDAETRPDAEPAPMDAAPHPDASDDRLGDALAATPTVRRAAPRRQTARGPRSPQGEGQGTESI